MIEFIRERWDIIFLSLAILVQWGVIINILGRMENLRSCMQILNKQNKSLKEYVEDLSDFNDEQHKQIEQHTKVLARNANDLCTLTKWWAHIAEEEEDKR